MSDYRKPEYKVHDLILGRWSPRAMTGEKISNEELMSLFEAAKWAPSSYNNQPWRFLYANRDSDNFKKFLSFMVPLNQAWAKNASVLVVVASRKNFESNNKPSRTHLFDTGAACENLALQGYSMGLVVHLAEGFDYEKAQRTLNIPEDFEVVVMIAIGRKASKEILPEEMRQREVPSGRKKISEIVFEGKWPE